MASHILSSFFLLLLAFVLILSPQTQAREGKFFSFFSHFTTNSHKLKSHHPHSPSPSPSPSSSESIAATPESILAAPAPAPESSTEAATPPVPSPAESEFVDRGDGYGLYGTTSFVNNNDNHESFKTGFGTKLYSNYNNNNNNDEVYRNSYSNNNQEYYSKDHRNNNYDEDSYYSANNNNDRYSYKNNNNFYDNSNGYNGGYERKREGMSDTRFVENGKYFYNLNQNDHKVDGYEPTGRGSTTYTENNNYGGSYYETNNNHRKYPNEFDTMEEYERQQEKQGYVP